MSYLNNFCPIQCDFPKKAQRLNNIENNTFDKPILCQRKHYLVHNLFYFPNSNITIIPLGVNSINNSKNKYNWIKTTPKSLLAHIISYERVTCCHASYSIYQAANESAAVAYLKLTRKWFNKSQFDDKFDLYQCSDFKDIIFDHPWWCDEKTSKYIGYVAK